MNDSYLKRAKEKISDPRDLVVTISRRARQLAHGSRPMVRTEDQDLLDIALLEVAEGLLEIEEGKSSE